MVKYKVITTTDALNCLRGIHDYIKDNASKQTAQKVYGGLLDEIAALSEHPHKNSILRTVGKNRIYRRRLKWSYKIIYTIEENENLVIVVYIAHEKQNTKKFKNIFE